MFRLFKNNLDTICQRFPKTAPRLAEDSRTQHTVVLNSEGYKAKAAKGKDTWGRAGGNQASASKRLVPVSHRELTPFPQRQTDRIRAAVPGFLLRTGHVGTLSHTSRNSGPSEGNQVFGIYHIVQLGCSEPLLSGKKGRNSSEIHIPRQGQEQAFQTHLPEGSSSALLCNSFLHIILYT